MKIVPLFHTPANSDELAEWINAHPPQDRAHLWTAAMMMHNLIASQMPENA